MRAKNNVLRKVKLPEPPKPALPVYEQQAARLAEARIENEGVDEFAHVNALSLLHHNVMALSDIVGEAAFSESGNKMPSESLMVVMTIINEETRVANWIAQKMVDRYRPIE